MYPSAILLALLAAADGEGGTFRVVVVLSDGSAAGDMADAAVIVMLL